MSSAFSSTNSLRNLVNFLFVSLTTTSVPQITKDGAAAATCPDSLVTPVGCSVASDGYDIEKKIVVENSISYLDNKDV